MTTTTIAPISVGEMRDRINEIQRIQNNVMKKDCHYGVIPGTKKPTLYKAGSEVLLTTFHIGVRLEVQDISTGDIIRYRVKAIGFHQPTGQEIGEGIGECSTGEEKYRWRAALCDEEYDASPESGRRVKFTKKWNDRSRTNDIFSVKQVKTDSYDLANTVLKMAKKRAQIDLTLTALAASDIFSQDIEDLPPELRPVADVEGSAPQGSPIEHEALTKSADLSELAKVMNSLTPDERKKYMPHYNARKAQLSGGAQ